ncbi:MAG: hypothetical protein IH851_10905 [Armatimonadetes bacterium]|nr:hypothetical protein [Armatimonadota bacterium]
MKPRRKYALPAEADRRLRARWAKGWLSVGCGFPVIALVAVLGRGFVSEPMKWAVDIASVGLMLFMIQRFSADMAKERLEIGRKAVADRRFEEAFAALEPFTRLGNRSFDGTGEGHYLLWRAASEVGEDDLAAHCLRFLARNRRGEWADRARKKLKRAKRGGS